MGYSVGRKHFVPFRIVDIDSNPVAGLHLSDFGIVFTKDNIAADQSANALTLVDDGSGRYVATYVPTLIGFYFLELYNTPTDIRIQDAQEIDTTAAAIGSDIVSLTQDYGGVGALKPNVSNPNTYLLFVFNSQDWQAGRINPIFALQQTALDNSGNWLSSPLPVNHGTYHIVVKSNTQTVVIRAFLTV